MPSERSDSSKGKSTKPFKPHRPILAPDSNTSTSDTNNRRRSRITLPQESTPDADEQSTDSEPAIPPPLLTKLLHVHFEDPNTRMSKAASKAVGKYMETFVREALARAAFERSKEAEQNGGGSRDMFLEVEDLEKLAPQLLLDF